MNEKDGEIFTRIRVSSSESSKYNLIDSREETCWISSHAKNQYIEIEMAVRHVNSIRIVFQPGFHPARGTILTDGSEKMFKMESDESSKTIEVSHTISKFRIQFLETYDPYNRICVYNIEIV